MSDQITHQKDADGIMRQIVPAHVLRAILDADGDDYTRPADFGPYDEWDVGEQLVRCDACGRRARYDERGEDPEAITHDETGHGLVCVADCQDPQDPQ